MCLLFWHGKDLVLLIEKVCIITLQLGNTVLQRKVRDMTDEERVHLLTQILTNEPPIQWKYLGRPGTALPGPAPQSPAEWCRCGR